MGQLNQLSRSQQISDLEPAGQAEVHKIRIRKIP
jgi:hypothetical protein